ncbi:MAG: YHS domain-containing protein [bacterium]|nr:YHS domain-containing protein [bacterium]
MVGKKLMLATALVVAMAVTAFACGGKCESKSKTASNSSATTKVMVAGGEKCAVKTAEMKDGTCPAGACTEKTAEMKKAGHCEAGSCSKDAKHTSTGTTSKTMVAGGEGVVQTAMDTKVVDGNVYSLADGSKRFLCPVMLAQGDVKDSPEYSDYNGKRYYHCCPGCKDKFADNPSKYLDALVIPANVTKVDGKKLTFLCPVTKEEGIVGKDTPYVDNGGKRYYLCCADCKTPFTKNPSKYSM